MATYKLLVYVSGLPGNLDEDDIDRIIYNNTKHASFSVSIEEILRKDEDD